MPSYNKIQIRRGTTAQWATADSELRYLAQGELGYDTTLKRFKIGDGNNTPWATLPWAGGSDISPGTGICLLRDSASNTYTITSVISSSGSGLVVNAVQCAGDGTTTPSGLYYSINLSDRLQSVSNINTAGFLVSNSTTGTVTRSLASGNNIDITNVNGSGGNPTISLSSNVTGLTNLSSTNLSITSGIVSSKLAVSGSLTLNGRDITTNIEAIPNTNTANFNLSVGSVTNVGSNGGPSYYGTYDQGGNVREIMHSGSTATLAVRGGNFANSTTDDALNKSIRGSRLPTDFGPGFGFRLASRENIGKSYPLSISAGTGIATFGSVVHGFRIGDPLKFANDSGLPTVLSSGVTYYVVGTGSTTFSVASGISGTAISFGGSNSTTSTFSAYDYGSFVRVENSGNLTDGSYGDVNYNYRIGKFEVTNDEYVEFLNAVARDDHDTSNTTHYISGFDRGLYEPLMETELPNNGISRNAVFPDYYYASLRGMNKKPVVFISYINAARYANWLHNGKPVSNRYKTCSIVNGTPTTVTLTNHGFANGDLITFNCIDGSSFGGGTLTRNTTFKVAGKTDNTFQVKTEANADVTFTGTGTFYVRKLFNKVLYIDNGAYTLAVNETTAKQKETNARYWIPTENEWYKAAYYDPTKNGTGSPGYWAYPTRSDTMPSGVSADANGNGSYNPGGTVPSHYHSSYDISDFTDRMDTILLDGIGTQAEYSPNITTGGSIAINVTGIPLSKVIDVTATAAEVNYLAGITLGSGSASKVLSLDNNKAVSGISRLAADTGVFASGSFGASTSADSASTLRVGGTGVSLSGHKHYYTPGQGFNDIPNFCSGVADCVSTQLVVSTGLRADLVSSNLQLSLSGQAATLHTFNSSGIIVRSGGNNNDGTFAARSITSGANINITNGDGIAGNPTIALAPSVTGLTDLTVDQIKIDGATISTTGNNDSLILSPHGTGTVNINKANITGGNINNTTIGATTPASGAFTAVSIDNIKIDTDIIHYNNVARIDLGSTETIINNPGNDIDFRVEGVNNQNLLFVDAGNARVGIGTNVPLSTLDVRGDAGVSGNFSVGGNLTVTGTTVIANVDTMRVKDPIINLGSADGTVITTVANDRGLSLSLGASLTGFLGWDTSASEFVMLSSGVPGDAAASTYTGTYGPFRAGTINTVGGFVGYGGSITGLYANNLSSGIVPRARLDGTYDISITGNAGTVTNGVYTGRKVDSGNGLSGGGDLSTDRTLSVVAGTGIIVNANGVHVNTSSVIVATGSQTISGVKTFENTSVFNSGLSIKNTAASSVNGFAVFDNDPTGGTARTLSYRSLSDIRTDLGTSTNTASRLVFRDSNGDFSTRYISVTGISGIITVGSVGSVYTSTSISGIGNVTSANATYLLNFVIDGGTP